MASAKAPAFKVPRCAQFSSHSPPSATSPISRFRGSSHQLALGRSRVGQPPPSRLASYRGARRLRMQRHMSDASWGSGSWPLWRTKPCPWNGQSVRPKCKQEAGAELRTPPLLSHTCIWRYSTPQKCPSRKLSWHCPHPQRQKGHSWVGL